MPFVPDTFLLEQRNMAPVEVTCPNCGRRLRGGTTDLTRDTGVCPKCHSEFEITHESAPLAGPAPEHHVPPALETSDAFISKPLFSEVGAIGTESGKERNRVSRFSYCGVVEMLPAGVGAILVLLGHLDDMGIDILPYAVVMFVIFAFLALYFVSTYSIKRLHDIGASGWNALWLLMPLANAFVLCYLLLTPGTLGPNRYGPDPINRHRMGRLTYFANVVVLFAGSGALLYLHFKMTTADPRAAEPLIGPMSLPDILIGLISLPWISYALRCHIRRFHDMGTSGWAVVVFLIPLVNIVELLWLLFVRGTRGPNQYGPEPRRRERRTLRPATPAFRDAPEVRSERRREICARGQVNLAEEQNVAGLHHNASGESDDRKYAPPGYFDGTPQPPPMHSVTDPLAVGVCDCCGATNIATTSLDRIDSGQLLCPNCMAALRRDCSMPTLTRQEEIPQSHDYRDCVMKNTSSTDDKRLFTHNAELNRTVQ